VLNDQIQLASMKTPAAIPPPLPSEQLEALGGIDTCTVANAIEQLDVRLRNEGFTNATIRSMFGCPKPVVGYAATVRIRCSNPPMEGHVYVDRTDWWSYLLAVPAPRVVVIQDVDRNPGTGTFLGEVHATILQKLGCVAAVTNGAVRDVLALEKIGLKIFAGNVSVSHAYSHIVDYAQPVEVGGLTIQSGDLLHADRHGVLSVPREIAAQIPPIAARLLTHERHVIELCHSDDFSLEKLRTVVKGVFD
jgi:4-hydroxy-4-methyl-2-oxoglutarate aldolase